MKTKTQLTAWTIFLIFVLCLSLVNVNTVLADDAPPTEPPTATEEVTEPPTEEATPVPEFITETPAPPESDLPGDAPAMDEEPSVGEVLSEIPDNTDVVILDENGNPVPLASQEALDTILEDDPMWCPAGILPGAASCRNFTGSSGITNLLTDMRNNTNFYDEHGVIYFTSNPGNGSFTLTNAATSLNTDFITLQNFNITLQGGWNGANGGAARFTGQTNFGTNYIAIGTSGNPWVGNVTILNMTVDRHTAANPSIGVFTTSGSATINNILVDDADNNESIRVSTGSGNINMTNVDVTDGDDDYALNLTTTSGNVTLTDILVDDHTDADAINIVGGDGTVTLNNADVTDGSDGDGINITTTGGIVNLNGVDVDSQDGGNGINVTTTSGNINLNDADVLNQEDGRTASLSSQSGNINVFNNSDFEGDNTNQGFFASTNTGSITITGTSSNRIEFTDAEGPGNGTNYNGATLNAPNVFLTYVTANDSDGNGILINATTVVTLNNVVADDNGTNPSGPGNALGSGVTVIGDGSTIVSVTGGTFTDNERYGIEVINGTLNFISMPTFDDNGLGRYFPGGQDTTGPLITPNVFCTNWGTNGWCRGTVGVTFNVDDPESNVSSESGCSGPFFGYFVVNSNTSPAGQTFTCTATSADGTLTSSSSATLYRDTANPTASASRSPAANAFGWNNTDVTVTFSGTDGNSGIAFCTAPIIRSANGAGQSASGNCTDVAGNVSSTVTMNNINIDKTPPVTTFVSRTPANGNGWNNGNVTVQWSCSDALSGVVSASVSQTVTTEGANQSTTGTCQDRAGNTASNIQAGINIDKTAPTLNLVNVSIEATSPAGANVNYSALASDNLDSSPTLNCLPASGGIYPLGTSAVTCTATDDAGNTSAPDSFNITVVDTTPPTIDVADMTVYTFGILGKNVTYSSPATLDIVDGFGVATCTPASESFFVLGNNHVTCSATDAHGNTSITSFVITVEEAELTIATSSGFFIPATGGSFVKLECVGPDSFNVNMAGARIIFKDLCDYEAFINDLEQPELPGELASGFEFIDGYTINISKDGEIVSPLPQSASVVIEFNIPNDQKDANLGVLYWNGTQWIEIAGEKIDNSHFMVDITAEMANSNTFVFVTK